MALPASAPTIPCTLSKPLLAEGTSGTITSAFLSIDRDLVWADTGETIYKDAVPIPIGAAEGPDAGTLAFVVIPTDVAGMRDAAGNTILNWAYNLRVSLTLASGVTRTVDYVFQPSQEDTLVDLDLVPHGGAASIPPVVGGTEVLDGGTP